MSQSLTADFRSKERLLAVYTGMLMQPSKRTVIIIITLIVTSS